MPHLRHEAHTISGTRLSFESWSNKSADVARARRLLIGGAAGATLVASGIAFVVLTSKEVEAQEEKEERVVQVELVNEPEPEPEPEPPPPPEIKPHVPNPGPRLPKLETPTEISQEKPQEKAVKPSGGEGDPYEKGGGDGSSGPKAAVVEAPAPAPPPPPPPPPEKKKPVPISEGMTRPEPIVPLVKPEYPPDAKAAGIEGVVLVRYVVDEQGNLVDVKAVKGPPELAVVCVAAVKAMKFKPALDADGKAVLVVSYMRFPFRLRT